MIYLWGVLLSIVVAAISGAMAYVFNPVTLILVHIAAPVVRLLGQDPAIQGFSSMGTMMWTSIIWPLTILPMHWLNYQILQWNHWAFAALVLIVGVLSAFVVLMITSSAT